MSTSSTLSGKIRTQAIVLGSFVGLLWIIELIDLLVLGGASDQYAIRPREMMGLAGIPLAPFLHGSMSHVAANTLPLVLLGWLVMLRSLREFFLVTLIVTLVGGLGVWVLASTNSVHLGASGLVFGYFGYLVFRAYFERSLVSLMVAAVVVLMYGGVLWGLLPSQKEISWEGHLFGFLAGVLAARVLARTK